METKSLLNKTVCIYNGALSNSNDFFLADLSKGSVMDHITAIYKYAVDNDILSGSDDDDLDLIGLNIISDNDSDEEIDTPIHILDNLSNDNKFLAWYKNISLKCTGYGYLEFVYN